MACPLGVRINRIPLYSPLLLSTQSAQEGAISNVPCSHSNDLAQGRQQFGPISLSGASVVFATFNLNWLTHTFTCCQLLKAILYGLFKKNHSLSLLP